MFTTFLMIAALVTTILVARAILRDLDRMDAEEDAYLAEKAARQAEWDANIQKASKRLWIRK